MLKVQCHVSRRRCALSVTQQKYGFVRKNSTCLTQSDHKPWVVGVFVSYLENQSITSTHSMQRLN